MNKLHHTYHTSILSLEIVQKALAEDCYHTTISVNTNKKTDKIELKVIYMNMLTMPIAVSSEYCTINNTKEQMNINNLFLRKEIKTHLKKIEPFSCTHPKYHLKIKSSTTINKIYEQICKLIQTARRIDPISNRKIAISLFIC